MKLEKWADSKLKFLDHQNDVWYKVFMFRFYEKNEISICIMKNTTNLKKYQGVWM